VTTGLLALLMTSPELAQTREQLGLDEHSRVLLLVPKAIPTRSNIWILSGAVSIRSSTNNS
jgi:hypothetical protein